MTYTNRPKAKENVIVPVSTAIEMDENDGQFNKMRLIAYAIISVFLCVGAYFLGQSL